MGTFNSPPKHHNHLSSFRGFGLGFFNQPNPAGGSGIWSWWSSTKGRGLGSLKIPDSGIKWWSTDHRKSDLSKGVEIYGELGDISSSWPWFTQKLVIYTYLSLLPSPRFMTWFLPIFCFARRGVGNKLTLATHSELYGLVWWISRRKKSKISPKNGDPFLLEQRVFLFTQHERSSNLDVPYHVTKIFGFWEFL